MFSPPIAAILRDSERLDALRAEYIEGVRALRNVYDDIRREDVEILARGLGADIVLYRASMENGRLKET